MKLQHLQEAQYEGPTVLVQVWSDDGQVLYSMHRNAAKRLKLLVQDYQQTESSEILEEISDIIADGKEIEPDLIYDSFNVEIL